MNKKIKYEFGTPQTLRQAIVNGFRDAQKNMTLNAVDIILAHVEAFLKTQEKK